MFDGWFFGLIGLVLTIVPLWKLLQRQGINPAWSLAAVTGIGLVVLLCVLAYGDDRRRP